MFRHRLPEIDRRRGELLAEVDRAGEGESLTALLRVFALPLFKQTDASGQHSYARFLIGLERSGMLAARAQVTNDFPETDRLTSRMAALLPPETCGSANFRMRLIFAMLGAALQLIDQDQSLPAEAARQLFRQRHCHGRSSLWRAACLTRNPGMKIRLKLACAALALTHSGHVLAQDRSILPVAPAPFTGTFAENVLDEIHRRNRPCARRKARPMCCCSCPMTSALPCRARSAARCRRPTWITGVAGAAV